MKTWPIAWSDQVIEIKPRNALTVAADRPDWDVNSPINKPSWPTTEVFQG